MLETKKVIGATKKEVEDRNFNVWIGISMGNKWFRDKENIKQNISWALRNTKEDILIVIADKLHSINYQVRNKLSEEKAMKLALLKGNEYCGFLNKIIKNFNPNEQKRINVIHWHDIERNEMHAKIELAIQQEFKNNEEFRKFIFQIVKDGVKRDTSRTYDKIQINKLARYVLEELPDFLHGIEYEEKKYYNLYTYPYSSSLLETLEDFQKNNHFSYLGEKFDIRRTVAVILDTI